MAVVGCVVRSVIAALGVVGSSAVGIAAASTAPADACLVVDTDVGIDDIRAFAVLAAQRELTAVVVTEGLSTVAAGASAISMFLAAGDQTPPVIAGRTSPAPPDYDFMDEARPIGETINGFLGAAIPFDGDPDAMAELLGAAVAGCARIDLLVLGPWTSAAEYLPQLSDRLGDVVASGRPLSENNPDNFNCEYDIAACEATSTLPEVSGATWVDLPLQSATSETTFAPTMEMITDLHHAGVPGLLRAALMASDAAWASGSRLWDDAAALYHVDPDSFAPVGEHVEPAVDEDRMRTLLVEAINALGG